MTTPQLRSSQVITIFGPGAMVDLPDASVLVAGLDHWLYDTTQPIPSIQEQRLVEKLKPIVGIPNLTLRAPPPAVDRDYGFCPNIASSLCAGTGTIARQFCGSGQGGGARSGERRAEPNVYGLRSEV